MTMTSIYTAARISKPAACVPALVGTPRTMDGGMKLWLHTDYSRVCQPTSWAPNQYAA